MVIAEEIHNKLFRLMGFKYPKDNEILQSLQVSYIIVQQKLNLNLQTSEHCSLELYPYLKVASATKR